MIKTFHLDTKFLGCHIHVNICAAIKYVNTKAQQQ